MSDYCIYYVVPFTLRFLNKKTLSAFFRHLDISRESRRTSNFKMTRKILTSIVQRLVNLVSLDISGHIMLDNCTVPHIEEAMGRPRWINNCRTLGWKKYWIHMKLLSRHIILSFSIEPCKSSIYPFQELKRPLQFLGLYDTTLCNVTHIPAYKVPVTYWSRHIVQKLFGWQKP